MINNVKKIILTVVLSLFLLSCKLDSIFEWQKEIGSFTTLDSTGIEYNISLPKEYGYKSLRMKIPDVEKKYLPIEVEIIVHNADDAAMHIVSHGYYSGKLSKGGKATVFKGNMESMIKLYSTGNAPRIANTKEKAKLKIRIRATKKINFEEPVFFYAYAADYP